jgi:hypothetical protein
MLTFPALRGDHIGVVLHPRRVLVLNGADTTDNPLSVDKQRVEGATCSGIVLIDFTFVQFISSFHRRATS